MLRLFGQLGEEYRRGVRPEIKPTLNGRLYFVLALLVMLGPLATSLYVPGLPSLADSFDITTAEAQMTVTTCLLGLACGQLFVGPMSDRFGRRTPALVGIAVFLVASVLCAVAPSWEFLLVVRFVQGLAGSATIVVARATVRDLATGTLAAVALSRLLVVTGLAPGIGPLIGGQLLRFADWRALFVTLAVAAALSLAAAWWWLPESLDPANRSSAGVRRQLRDMGSLLRDRDVLASMAVIGLLGGVTFSWMASGPFYFEGVYGLSPAMFSTIIAAASIVFVFGALLNTRVVRHIGVRRALVQGLLLVALFASAVLVTGLMGLPVWWVALSAVLTMGVYGGMGANAQALALTPHGDRAGAVAALLGTMQFVGGALLPPLATLIVGGTWAMGVGMAISAIGALIVAAMLTRRPVSVA